MRNLGITLKQPFTTYTFHTTPSSTFIIYFIGHTKSLYPKSVSELRSNKNGVNALKSKEVQGLMQKYEFNKEERKVYTEFLQVISNLNEGND